MDDKLVFEALRRGLITEDEARERLKSTPAVPAKADNQPPTGGSPVTRFAKGAFEGIGQAGLGVAQFAVDALTPATFATGVRDTLEQPLTAAVDRSRSRVNELGTAGTVGQIGGNIVGSIPFALAGAEAAVPATGSAIIKAVSPMVGRILGSAVVGGTEGAKQPLGTGDSRAVNTGVGALTSGVVQGGVEGAKATNNAILPQVGDATAVLAKRAQDLGIPVSVQNLSPTKTRNTLQKVSQAIPFSGVQKFEDTQRSSWNKAIANTLGEEDLGPEAIKNFLDRSSKGFDEVLSGKDVTVNPVNVESLDTLVDNARGSISNNLVQVVQKNVDDLKKNIGGDGYIKGEKLASFRSELLKRIARAEGGAKEYLGEIVDVVDDLLDTSLDDASKESLGQLRRQWRNYRTLEPLLEKSTTGEVNPTTLLNRVAASPYIRASRTKTGDDALVDLARIGKEFLPKLSGSDTFEKTTLVGQGAAGATALLDPTAATVLGGSVATNRAFQKLYNQNPSVVNAVIEKSLGGKSSEAVKLLKKGAPLDVVAKAISQSGAPQEKVDEALSGLSTVVRSVKDNSPLPSTPKAKKDAS